MSVIIILIAVSLTLALGFLAAFVWAVRHGQYEDTCTPAMRILSDDPSPGMKASPSETSNQAKP